ncbi:hypothetical protein AVU90_gp59 [Enterococcus phage IME-EFm5]|uniref:Uncharacterized protein n=1 Tax=Enterococcus phage IME-EFm5 TaxID=1718158 RepID=A0A0M4QWG2_9CAUD|nr:hypothetical protein AVU90_gp59 [Enterococcus phage IME-EFm5]ALF02028.1 hypothetical protein EFm5_59 [Enterococcus phage IME-EFm5]
MTFNILRNAIISMLVETSDKKMSKYYIDIYSYYMIMYYYILFYIYNICHNVNNIVKALGE